jgi:putative ABC transport system ATP-binding protein
MPDPFVLELIDVGLTLPSTAGPVNILDGASLAVAPGERVSVMGPSGSGKSSLIAIASGLEQPTRGEVRLFGENLAGLNEDDRARLRRGRVALVFQSFQLLPNMTAEENVMAPLEIARRATPRIQARDWLDRVGLSHRLGHYPGQLSGGEQQRVALARALAVEPELLFADEPTGNLDQATANQVADLMISLIAETKAALVLVTHDAALGQRADRHLRMDFGRLAIA